jgi:hypothetical protein
MFGRCDGAVRLGYTSRSYFRQKNSLVDEPLSEGDAVGEVDLQDSDSNPADWGEADQDRAVPAEMSVPLLASRVEQGDELFVTSSLLAMHGPL